jgi:hypothetical protein
MIITCCPSKVHNGVWRHLKELEQFGTCHYDVDDNIPMDVKVVIFGGAWNADYARINADCKNKRIRTGLLFCSPFGQATLSNEIPCFNQAYELLRNRTIDYLFTGTKEMADLYKDERIIYLPQTLDYEAFLKKTDKINPEINKECVGLFCSKAVHKNIPNQLMSLKRTKYHLFTNALDAFNVQFALHNNIRYTNFDWLDEDNYYSLLKSIPVHLQCSFSEAFDYVAAETLLLERPILVGPSISWIKDSSLVVNNIDNPFEIKQAIERLMNTWESKKAAYKNMAIKELDKRAEIAKDVLKNI